MGGSCVRPSPQLAWGTGARGTRRLGCQQQDWEQQRVCANHRPALGAGRGGGGSCLRRRRRPPPPHKCVPQPPAAAALLPLPPSLVQGQPGDAGRSRGLQGCLHSNRASGRQDLAPPAGAAAAQGVRRRPWPQNGKRTLCHAASCVTLPWWECIGQLLASGNGFQPAAHDAVAACGRRWRARSVGGGGGGGMPLQWALHSSGLQLHCTSPGTLRAPSAAATLGPLHSTGLQPQPAALACRRQATTERHKRSGAAGAHPHLTHLIATSSLLLVPLRGYDPAADYRSDAMRDGAPRASPCSRRRSRRSPAARHLSLPASCRCCSR